jgi:hypothetical protein
MEAPSLDKSHPAMASESWAKLPVSALPQKFPMTILPSVSCGDCVDILKREGFDQIPVVNANGCVAVARLFRCLIRSFFRCFPQYTCLAHLEHHIVHMAHCSPARLKAW